jgi:Peptidase S46.
MPALASADEGMWMVNLINSRIEALMQEKGCHLDGKTIYDENETSLSDAVVSLAFGCSGSMISDDGLMITNHHCAYADVHALSTPEHNYLEDGFWALKRDEELPVPSDGIFFLKKVLDVTDEVMHLRDSTNAEGKVFGMRKVYALIETKYSKIFAGQGEVSCDSFFGGQKYYLALYQVYKDVRLVAAPPVSIASFGAEVDNWEWPQQKGDFAIYRIYTAPDGSPAPYSPDNVPLHPKRKLKVSTKGVSTGDFVMIMGYPGVTNRYASSFAVDNIAHVVNPIDSYYRKEQMKILDGWMNQDPLIRLKYADQYFMLSNVQEIREGEIYCYDRFGVVDIKRRQQDEVLQEWIDSDPDRKAKWGDLIPTLGEKYKAIADIQKQTEYYRGTLVRGVRCIRPVNYTVHAAQLLKKEGKEDQPVASCGNMGLILHAIDELDYRVEKDLFDYSAREFYVKVDRAYWSDYMKELYDRFDGDTYALTDWVWNNSSYTDPAKFRALLDEPHTQAFFEEDPFYRFIHEMKITVFNNKKAEIEGDQTTSKLEKEYKKALYLMYEDKGIPQYPDANSTMRLTYGTVGGISPKDGVTMRDFSTTRGVLEKYDPDVYIYTLKPEFKALLDALEEPMPVNFLSNNDITGGNSGSPVMNADGELVGLAFDGNKEGLAGDTYFDPEMNKTVSVDIRYVLWVLKEYMCADPILDEIFAE